MRQRQQERNGKRAAAAPGQCKQSAGSGSGACALMARRACSFQTQLACPGIQTREPIHNPHLQRLGLPAEHVAHLQRWALCLWVPDDLQAFQVSFSQHWGMARPPMRTGVCGKVGNAAAAAKQQPCGAMLTSVVRQRRPAAGGAAGAAGAPASAPVRTGWAVWRAPRRKCRWQMPARSCGKQVGVAGGPLHLRASARKSSPSPVKGAQRQATDSHRMGPSQQPPQHRPPSHTPKSTAGCVWLAGCAGAHLSCEASTTRSGPW